MEQPATHQERASAWLRAMQAASDSYGEGRVLDRLYEYAREGYAAGRMTFEQLDRRIDELLAQGL